MAKVAECSPVWRKLIVCGPAASALALAASAAGEYMTDEEREQSVKYLVDFEAKMGPLLNKWTGYPPRP